MRGKLKGYLVCGIVLLGAFAFALVMIAGDDHVLAGGSPASFTIEEVFGAKGRNIDVEIKYEDITYFLGAHIELTYDAAILNPISVTAGDDIPVLGGGVDSTFQDNLSEPGRIVIIWAHHGDDGHGDPLFAPVSGTFCTITFEMLDEGLESQLVFDLDETEIFAADGDGREDANLFTVPAGFNDGKVDVYDVTFGDVNEDSDINVVDALLILRYRVGDPDVVLDNRQILAADVNLDGELNVVDALLILRYRVGDPAVPVLPVEPD